MTIDHIGTIKTGIEKEGYVILSEMSEFEFFELLQQLGEVHRHRDANEHGVTRIQYDARTASKPGYAGFSNDRLELHTDRSSIVDPPDLLAMRYLEVADTGGYLQIADGKRVLTRLAELDTALLASLLSAQGAFQADNDSFFTGRIIEQVSERRFAVRFRLDAKGFFTKKEWSIVDKFLTHAYAVSEWFRLKSHQVVIINNRRCLHGRTAFSGRRSVNRVLLDASSWLAPGF